jgi:hypothetical protein
MSAASLGSFCESEVLVLARAVAGGLDLAAALRLVVGDVPAPQFRAVAAGLDALAVDVGDHAASPPSSALVPHMLGAGRQLALGDAVAAVLLELGFRGVRFRPAGAEGALVHLAAVVEQAGFRELRRAERAGVIAVAAADALVLECSTMPSSVW